MSEVTTVACDVCHVLKKEANHWFKGYILALRRSGTDPVPVGVMVLPIDVDAFTAPFIRHGLGTPDAHLCGLVHAQQWQQQILDKAKPYRSALPK